MPSIRKRIGYLPSLNIQGIINKIAKEHYSNVPYSIKLLMKGLGLKNRNESELLSFLLFESSFTSSLIELGYEDGMRKQSAIEGIVI